MVGEAANGHDAVRLARETMADVVLMDIRMPGMDGLAATSEITSDEAMAGVRVLVLTTFEIDEYVFAALRAGASGFLGKSVEAGELQEAIRVVARGEALLSPVGDQRADHPVPGQPRRLGRARARGPGRADRARKGGR